MTERTAKVIKSLVHSHQTGFTSGRYIIDNIGLMMDVIHYCDQEDIEGIIVMLDMEKAYDRVDHDWIIKCLKNTISAKHI